MNPQSLNGGQPPPETPEITLAGSTVDRLFQHLTNPTVLAKGADGAMHPFIDPNPVIMALREAVIAELKRSGAGMGQLEQQELRQ